MTSPPPEPSGSGLVGVSDAVRLRLDLGYDGAGFHGWAVQPSLRSVQGDLQQALATLLRLDEVRLAVAGRTDTGVHAIGQVAHCDVPVLAWADAAPKAVRRLAGLLAPDLRVHSIAAAPEGFDARFSAVWRRYRYRICDAESGGDPLRRHDTAHWRRRLDTDAMIAAADSLLGLHDFAAYCRRREGATTIREIQSLTVARDGDLVVVEVRADAFCHSMVRSLVGALAQVGEGARRPDWIGALLTLERRSDDVAVAPPHGLTLVEVGYPSEAELAARAEQTRAVRTLPR